jgi:hypothetical protein
MVFAIYPFLASGFIWWAELVDSRMKWIPIPISISDMKAVNVPNDNQSTGSDVMNAMRKTYSTESKSRAPPRAKSTIPLVPLEFTSSKIV